MKYLFEHLDADLDGTKGSNRCLSGNQIGANKDVDAIETFISNYNQSIATYKSYRKECYRLLLWATEKKNKALSSLDWNDAKEYIFFLENPDPKWCGLQSKQLNAQWMPFQGPLSDSSRRTAVAILKSLMVFLVDAGYLNGNPFVRIRVGKAFHRSIQKEEIEKRCLSDYQWKMLVNFLDTQTSFHYKRAKFLISLMYFLGLRVNEVVRHVMSDFHQVRNQWRFAVIGKGNKRAWIPVAPDMVIALQEYRTALNLPPLPTSDDETPLIGSLDMARGVTSRRLSQIIHHVMHAVADTMDDSAEAKQMRLASPHWFRHTGLSRQGALAIPLLQIRDNARHASLNTTSMYLHSEDDERHKQIAKLKWVR